MSMIKISKEMITHDLLKKRPVILELFLKSKIDSKRTITFRNITILLLKESTNTMAQNTTIILTKTTIIQVRKTGLKLQAASTKSMVLEIIKKNNRRVHQSYLEGHSLNQDINSNSFESKYSSHKKIHVSKNHGDFRLSLTKKSKNNLRYGQKNMIHSTPRKSQINLLKKVNSMGDNFKKSNFKSLKTLQGKLQSDTNLGSLSKSQAIENSFISNHRVKAERARKIFLRNNQSI